MKAAFAELLGDDVNWVNIVGMHWWGKAAVVKAHEVFHRTIFRNTEMTITDVAITVITSDAAVAVVTLKMGEFTTPDGERKMAAAQDRLSLILAKREGGWKITHGHNTVIDPNAEPFDPVNSGWKG